MELGGGYREMVLRQMESATPRGESVLR